MSDEIQDLFMIYMEEQGIVLPKGFGNEKNRAIYRAFLADNNLDESAVAPILDKKKVPPEAYGVLLANFFHALQEGDRDKLNKITSFMAPIFLEHNTNVLIASMVQNLLDDLEGDEEIPSDFFVGVFPTNIINASCRLEQGISLILIDSGLFEMIEATMVTYISHRNDTEKAQLLISFLEDYYSKGVIPDVLRANHPSIDWGSRSVSIFANVVEEFVLMHELGHAALGHRSVNQTYENPTLRNNLAIQKRSHLQEYQADVWALTKLINRAEKQENTQFALELTYSGARIFLYIAMMLEALCESRNYTIYDSHPSASDRIYVLEVTLELLGYAGLRGYSEKFKRLIRELCVLEGVQEKLPPLLSRDLNLVAKQVYESLDMSYEHLPYLVEFV